ncbi:MAG: hypothetical protein GX295_11375 [Syntrophomonadaceae bacterium]|nr:hypothetical protein [Syntrophomonadaceae bacterium]
MTAFLWNFQPFDTLFIRDGTPFNAGEGGMWGIKSLFPPPITTCQGAIRTALAYGRGWTPGHNELWPEELGGPNDLGVLELRGPFMRREGDLLYEAPLLVLGNRSGQDITFHRLYPLVKKRITCDLNPKQGIVLPGLKEKAPGAQPLTGFWFTKKGIEDVLAGGIPSSQDVFQSNELWDKEGRVGIALNRKKRTAQDSQLYSTFHVRMQRGVSFCVRVEGVPDDWHRQAPPHITFGGEGRVASIKPEPDGGEYLPRMPELETDGGKVRFTVILITPAFFAEQTQEVIRQGPIAWIPGKCISACMGKAVQLGGWDMARGKPRSLQAFLPAGTTWFFEAEEKYGEQIKALHGACLGENTEMGYGQVIIGRLEGVK